ncbi:MAG: DNA polymerase IV [Deltaproteobacteria bacterium]|nr:DNA polymerase IV [Deltaproteobacteria bacterium]
MSRAIIHVDMDAFFASVELKRRPELKGLPVIVGGDGDPKKRGVVSAASYEARRFGIRSGMPLRTAYKKCPQAVFLPVDFEAYERESDRFMAILREYTPLIESFGLDEAFMDVTDCPIPALDIAREIKRRIREGLGLTTSVGIAPNKLLAKMASDINKPNGFTVVMEKDVERFLSNLSVRKLWGVGEKTEKRLHELGIKTIRGLAKVPLQHLIRNFGVAFGRMLYEHSHGIDESPVVPFYEPNSMSREITYQEDTRDLYLIKETFFELTKDVVDKLKDEGYKAKTVTLKIRYSDFQTITRAKTIAQPTDSFNDIWTAVVEILNKVDMAKKVRLVGVKVSNLFPHLPRPCQTR